MRKWGMISMPKERFTFKESCELLQINPKSFQQWLKKAKIDPEKQIDKSDPRKKYLTRDQLIMLAEEHGRTLSFEEEEPEHPSGDAIEALDGRLATWEQQITNRIAEAIETRLQAVEQQIALRLDQTAQQTVQRVEQLDQRVADLALQFTQWIADQNGSEPGPPSPTQTLTDEQPIPSAARSTPAPKRRAAQGGSKARIGKTKRSEEHTSELQS